MRLILHLGAYGTDDGVIAGWIAENRTTLAQDGIATPQPGSFLQALSAAASDTQTDPLTREEAVLRRLGASGARRWMAVSAPGLLGAKTAVLAPEGFYVRDVARRMYGLRTVFPRCKMTILLAIRQASGVLPALLPADPKPMAEQLSQLRSDTLPWAQLARVIRGQLPHAQLVVWRHEDFAAVWPQVLAQISGPLSHVPQAGLLTLAAKGLSAQATLRLQRYCATNPPATVGQLRHLAKVFAVRFGTSTASDPVPDLPVWALAECERLDRGYLTEWDDIIGQPGVTALLA